MSWASCSLINLFFSMGKRQTLSFKCLIHLYCMMQLTCTKSGRCLKEEYLMAVNDLVSNMMYSFGTALISPVHLLWAVKNFKECKNGYVS